MLKLQGEKYLYFVEHFLGKWNNNDFPKTSKAKNRSYT